MVLFLERFRHLRVNFFDDTFAGIHNLVIGTQKILESAFHYRFLSQPLVLKDVDQLVPLLFTFFCLVEMVGRASN